MADQETRTCEILNQKLVLESNTEVIGVAGKTAYIIQSETSDGVQFNQSLHESSGLSRFYAEKTLQLESGIKNTKSNKSFELISHNGSIDITSRKSGNINIKSTGGTICLEADSIVLKAKDTIDIGNKNRTTDQINLNARKIQVSRNNGNLGDWMKISDKYKGFASSFVSNKLGNIGPSSLSKGGLAKFAIQQAATAYLGPVGGQIAGEVAGQYIEG